MADDKTEKEEKTEEESTEEEPTEETVEKELAKLQDDLEKPPEEVAKEAVETEKADDFDVRKAALSVIANLSREEQVEEFRKLGHEIAPAKQVQADKEEIAKEAQRLTMDQALSSLNGMVSESELPEGYHDAEPEQKNAILVQIAAQKQAKAMVQEALAPLQQQQEQQQMSAKLDAASVSWAEEFGAPGSASEIRAFVGTFSPEELQILEAQMEAGGGPFSGMVGQHIKGIASAHTRADEARTEKPLPASEDVGGGDSEDVSLTGDAKTFYDQAKADKDFPNSELPGLAKSLAGIG